MIKKPELLAPAGSFEKAKVAFMYGADAVYCGTGELSLRSRSPINEEELAKIINYAHSIGKRVHVTLILMLQMICMRQWKGKLDCLIN